ncbi:hypothetical protein FCM35_KLT15390 [Carex littledalei]|uniref:Uncharacterized protein n=1 Tax=Carex littledalei TaxID=544730 RepID=A0A833RUV7_9POAL|nr:hypothetical protein FCM35_KLT15390 [Carex littledalei]
MFIFGAAIDLPVTQAAAVEDEVVSELHGKSVTTPSASVVATVSYSDMPEFCYDLRMNTMGLLVHMDSLQLVFLVRTLPICPAGAPTVQCGACSTVTKVYPQGHPTYVDSFANSSVRARSLGGI